MHDSTRGERIARAVNEARGVLNAVSCDFAEIRLSAGISSSIALSGSHIESFSVGENIGGSIRVLRDGAWGFISFNDISQLRDRFRRALEIAIAAPCRDRHAVAKMPAGRASFAMSMERDPESVPPGEKLTCLQTYNEILRSSQSVVTTRAIYHDAVGIYAYLNSEGTEYTYDRTYCGISLSATARDGSRIQPFTDSVSGYGGFEIAADREAMAERVVKTAVDLLSAESPAGGTYRVVADQKLAGVFIHEAFGHLSEADFVFENPQLRDIMVLGKKFGPDGLNVIDCGTLKDCAGYIPFDDEGVPSGETRLITNGCLSGRLHSRETALKMGEEPTGNARAVGVTHQPIVRMTNTYIDNGNQSFDEMIEAAGDGVYACGVIGGETNLEMFTFTAAYGYEIKNGRIGRIYRDIVLSGNVFTTLNRIIMIGDDRRMFGGLGGCGKAGQSPLPVSFGGPHILIDGAMIGGTL